MDIVQKGYQLPSLVPTLQSVCIKCLTTSSPAISLVFNIFNLTAFITILANDDGPGILSFNNSEHFFLQEPTALYIQQSVAVLYIVREPAQGLFGTVTVQFIVTEVNSSVESKDLTPSKGYIVLEEGVHFKVQYEPLMKMSN